MKINALMEVLPDNFTVIDREQIQRAYNFAESAHAEQKRASGEPYVTHCVAVATILAEMHTPPAVIIAGLLHDTVEDTPTTLADIKREFGEEVARMVDGVTKLTNLPRVSRADQHNDEINARPVQMTEEEVKKHKRDLTNETLRKVFLAMGDDIRVVLIKLADRLHNMRTLGFMPEHKRRRIGQETLDIFAPLANRLGIWQIKWELEDLGFRYTNPEKYREIAENLSEKRMDREQNVVNIVEKLNTLLTESGLTAEVSGRPKHIYSIYRKMVAKGLSFDMVRDLRGVRLIVPDIPACYAALGVIHTHWRPIPHEFDDYIAAPKDNFYQSLHTAIIYDDGRPLEVQIRTPEMNQNAEYGIAAHWRYKESSPRDQLYEERINWLRRLMEWRKEVEDAAEFVEGMKSDVFQDRVYVFTPRGDIIDLPNGATPIDFAYHIHTEIGHRCRGAKVNSKLVTLDYTLKTGEQIQILTAKQGGPSRDWLNSNLGLVRTQRARTKIQSWFKRQDREQNLSQGKTMLDRELHRLGVSDLDYEKILHALGVASLEDLYVELGTGGISLGRVINLLVEEDKEKDLLPVPKPPSETTQKPGAITVVGLRGLLTTVARCCNPAPGDEIVGYITRGRGCTIHRQDCPNILRMQDRERIVKVAWGEPKQTYPVSVLVKAYDRQGLMGDISQILNNESINLVDLNVNISRNLANIRLVVEVSDISQLSRILTRIENLPNIMEAHRMRPN